MDINLIKIINLRSIMKYYFILAKVLLNNHSHHFEKKEKKRGVVVYFVVFVFIFLPFFLPLQAFKIKSKKLFISSNQAHAMDVDSTEPGRNSPSSERPNLKKRKIFDISDLTVSFQKFDEMKEKKKKILKTEADQLKEIEEQKYRQSKIYTVLKPKMGEELSKIHQSSYNKPMKHIKKLYRLPRDLPTKYWEEVSEHLLGREDESLWYKNLEELRKNGLYSSFYKSVADWWIENRES